MMMMMMMNADMTLVTLLVCSTLLANAATSPSLRPVASFSPPSIARPRCERSAHHLRFRTIRPAYASPAQDVADFFAGLFPKRKATVDVAGIKESIRSLARGTQNGIAADASKREEIADLVRELESANPTRKLTASPLLDGEWSLLYTTNDGSSAGKIGPLVGDVIQDIRLGENEYENIVSLGNGLFKGRLTATWDNLSPSLWKVKFQTLKLELLGITLQEKDLKAEGTWRMSYLDDNFRVLYAIGGKNTKKENIYILAK